MMSTLLIAAVCAFPAADPGEDLTEKETLRALDGVMLIVEKLHENAKRIQLSGETLEKDVTEKLKAAGIKRLSSDERLADERRPYLYINCHIMYVESIKLTSFSIDVEVHQRVSLANGKKAQGLTWAKSYLGIQSQANAARKIRDVVAEYVDEFIAAATQDDEKTPADGAVAAKAPI